MQLFGERANLIARGALVFGFILLFGGGGALYYVFSRSPFMTRAQQVVPQPVPFSHMHHVRGIGLDCRYCHTTVESAADASVPATQICMNCHTDIWANSPMLAEDRRSWSENRPLRWTRVHDLAGFVYFNHSVHVANGFGCSTCHGRLDLMPLTRTNQALFMAWCIDCHLAPERNIRPREEVFDMAWTPPPDQIERGKKLMVDYQIRPGGRIDCVTCHR
jgi:hypothetical protein